MAVYTGSRLVAAALLEAHAATHDHYHGHLPPTVAGPPVSGHTHRIWVSKAKL